MSRRKSEQEPTEVWARVESTSPYGRPGDDVRVDPTDARVAHYLATGVLARLDEPATEVVTPVVTEVDEPTAEDE